MRTVTFKSVYSQVVRLCALDPADATFSAARQEMVADCINRRVREAWEYAAWPELCVMEERTPVSGLIAYAQSGQTVLGEVFAVWDKDPRVYPDTAKTYAFEPTENGIQILDTLSGSTVWLNYRRSPNKFTRAAFDAVAGYVLGDLMYYETNGECYQATEDGNGSETWTLISFPYVIEQYVVLAAASDVYRDSAQHEKADELEARAVKAIEDQYDKTFGQQAQNRRISVKVE
jgi:hypothetical protein